jgi:branched-chain amino acid transport system substrate-binding protein
LITEEIVRALKRDITEGRISTNGKLPPEKTLRERFGAGRSSIREAFKIMEGMGLIVIKKGRGGGAFVSGESCHIAMESLSGLFKLEESNILSFTEFRKTIEPKMCFLAALNRMEPDLRRIGAAVELFSQATRSPEIFMTATRNFHVAMTEATHNDYLKMFYAAVVPVLVETAKLLYEIPTCVDLAEHFYGQIYDAIVRKEPTRAQMIADAYLVQIESIVTNAKNFGIRFGTNHGKIKWGAMLDLTGATLDVGKQVAMGMIDAARYLNEKGGINGKKIELMVHDDRYQISEGQAAYKRFRDQEKVLGMYLQSTGTAVALAPQATADQMFLFTGATTARLTNPAKHPYHFSLGPTYSDMVRIAIRFIADAWNGKTRPPKLVFIFPDNIYGKDMLKAAYRYAKELQVEVGPEIIVDWPTLDATPQLLSMQEYDPDYAFIASTAMNAASILRDSRKLRIRTRYICNNRTFTEALPKQAMGTAEGVLGIQPIAPYGADVPGMESIIACHDKWHPYHEATLAYVEGWVNLLVPMEACRMADEAGELNCLGLKRAMETLRDYDVGGLTPPLSYFGDDHRATAQARVWSIQDGIIQPYTGYIDVGRPKAYFEL